jgi:hypothetical protein
MIRRDVHPHRLGAIVLGLTNKGERQLERAVKHLAPEGEHAPARPGRLAHRVTHGGSLRFMQYLSQPR